MWGEDLCEAPDYRTFLQKNERMTSSHLFHVTDANSRNGPIHGQYWPPQGIAGPQGYGKQGSIGPSWDDKYNELPSPWSIRASSINNQYQRSSCSTIFPSHAKLSAQVRNLQHTNSSA